MMMPRERTWEQASIIVAIIHANVVAGNVYRTEVYRVFANLAGHASNLAMMAAACRNVMLVPKITATGNLYIFTMSANGVRDGITSRRSIKAGNDGMWMRSVRRTAETVQDNTVWKCIVGYPYGAIVSPRVPFRSPKAMLDRTSRYVCRRGHACTSHH